MGRVTEGKEYKSLCQGSALKLSENEPLLTWFIVSNLDWNQGS